jgi:hypothetical protein
MPVHRERRWPRITAGYAALLLVTGALTAFLYDAVAAESRVHVIRYAAAFLVAVILIHLRCYFRGDPRWEPPAQFTDALAKEPSAAKLDPGFAKRRDEVANSLASWSYFEKMLWPRLCALARAHGAPGDLPLPGERGWWGRGPPARTLAALIDRIAGSGSKPR